MLCLCPSSSPSTRMIRHNLFPQTELSSSGNPLLLLHAPLPPPSPLPSPIPLGDNTRQIGLSICQSEFETPRACSQQRLAPAENNPQTGSKIELGISRANCIQDAVKIGYKKMISTDITWLLDMNPSEEQLSLMITGLACGILFA